MKHGNFREAVKDNLLIIQLMISYCLTYIVQKFLRATACVLIIFEFGNLHIKNNKKNLFIECLFILVRNKKKIILTVPVH